jgi:thiamine biosynthesis protein ThiI
MDVLFLIKPGEILLKKENQGEFTRRLVQQIYRRMGEAPCKMEEYPGRFFLFVDEANAVRAEFVLAHSPGVNGFTRAKIRPKSPQAITAACVDLAKTLHSTGTRSFKVETRRSDKSFPLGSYQMSALAGEAILAALPDLAVDVHSPDAVITVEIRERAYIYGPTLPGPRGLPVGSSGKGLLLLSGGIDSPVAGYLMARRGAPLECVHFHSYPYTSLEARRKVESLALQMAAWCGPLRLWVLSFTEIQMHIKQKANPEATTIMLRSAMMDAADRLAFRIGADMIVTGESLGQVASQTAENMAVTQAPTRLPVFRPLIGMDKEDTIAIARRIGTYETSILPYEDCCVLFSPRHPVLKPRLEVQRAAYEALELGQMIEESLKTAEKMDFTYREVRAHWRI